MAFEFELPDVGEGVAEGEIVAWHVEVGDHVTEDQVLAEVETDKAVVDLPSPVEGVVQELHAAAGDVVAVGSVVVTIDVDGAEPDADDETAESASADTATESDADGASTAATEQPAAETAEVPAGGDSERVFAPPHVRRLARELDVDISTVAGSGPSGRVTEADVRAAASAGTTAETADTTGDEPKQAAVKRRDSDGESTSPEAATGGDASAASGSTAGAADRERTLATPATRKAARERGVDIDAVPTEKTKDGEAFVDVEDVVAFDDAGGETEPVEATPPAGVDETDRETREAYRGIRRTIGEQMAESADTVPHATHHDTAEVSALVEARADLKARAAEQGVSLTYLPFVMKALVAALKEYPVLNTELDTEAEEIVYKHYYNVGVAVATEAGLMVPVVENVDQKGLRQLAAEVAELTDRARSREITPAEMRGGTITVTNFGAIGGEYATPIINHPETAILGLGAIKERPVVEDGAVVARHTLPLSLSIDHRVIDGAEAAQFCNTLIEYLENPTLLLLE